MEETNNNQINNEKVFKADFARSLGYDFRTFRRLVKEIAEDPENDLKVTRKHFFTPKEQKILRKELCN